MLGRTVGYKGYVVHCDGRVWRPTQTRVRKDGVSRVIRGGWVASRVRNIQIKSGGGYVYIDLWVDHKSECWLLHRLIATLFIPNPGGLPQVNHMDGNRQNNHTHNLEWVSVSENHLHAYNTLNRARRYKVTDEQAREIYVKRNTEKLPLAVIGQQYGISFQSVSRIAKGGHYGVRKEGVQMPSSKNYVRDLRRERETARQRGELALNAPRKQARRDLEKEGLVKPFDNRDVDHVKPLSKGGSTGRSNLRAVSRSKNRSRNGHKPGE